MRRLLPRPGRPSAESVRQERSGSVQDRFKIGSRASRHDLWQPSHFLARFWARLGPILGDLWAILGRLGAILSHLAAVLGPSSWGDLGAILGQRWAQDGPRNGPKMELNRGRRAKNRVFTLFNRS